MAEETRTMELSTVDYLGGTMSVVEPAGTPVIRTEYTSFLTALQF